MIKRTQSVIGIILTIKERQAGSATIDVKDVAWADAHQIVLLPT